MQLAAACTPDKLSQTGKASAHQRATDVDGWALLHPDVPALQSAS